MTKTEIITATEKIFNRFSETCNSTNEVLFFKKPDEKWSVAENIQHLITSIKITSLAYRLPKFIVKFEIKYGKQKLMYNWQKATVAFIKALTKNRTEKDLDNYLAKHPLLGRITLRELCYFTIFHTEHHLLAINKISTNQ
jgi:hypothetical protein